MALNRYSQIFLKFFVEDKAEILLELLLINKTKYILTFVDCIKSQQIAAFWEEKYAEKHKKTCGAGKTVVILQPQTGNATAPRKQREH